eukprot:scaffold18130_cov119-Isochrysis_galbana.AAC.1
MLVFKALITHVEQTGKLWVCALKYLSDCFAPHVSTVSDVCFRGGPVHGLRRRRSIADPRQTTTAKESDIGCQRVTSMSRLDQKGQSRLSWLSVVAVHLSAAQAIATNSAPNLEIREDAQLFVVDTLGCSNACPGGLGYSEAGGSAGDGICSDGGPGAVDGRCAYGTDCDDCGTRMPLPKCTDSCADANDGVCQDGGRGSVSDSCAHGTDCTDCHPRSPFEMGSSRVSRALVVESPTRPPWRPPVAPPLMPPSEPPSTQPPAPPSTPPFGPPSTPPFAPPSTPPSAPPSTPPSEPPSTPPYEPPSTTPSARPTPPPPTSPIPNLPPSFLIDAALISPVTPPVAPPVTPLSEP